MTTFEDYIATTVAAVAASAAFTFLINEAIVGVNQMNLAMLDKTQQAVQAKQIQSKQQP